MSTPLFASHKSSTRRANHAAHHGAAVLDPTRVDVWGGGASRAVTTTLSSQLSIVVLQGSGIDAVAGAFPMTLVGRGAAMKMQRLAGAAGCFTAVTDTVITGASQLAAPVVPDRWSVATERLRGFLLLDPDWDGNGAPRPSRLAIVNAMSFADRMRKFVPQRAPRVFIMGDGEVGFEWVGGQRFVSAAFHPDGHIVAYATGSGWNVLEVDEPYSDAWPLGELANRIGAL